MSYQSNPSRAVEESYDDSAAAATQRLLPDSNINVGTSNSARGEGTTTSELVAKMRFLNCCACLFIVLFHTLPILMNPIRLTLLISSPMKLILELIVCLLALSIFLVEARIPILGERVLLIMRGFAMGGTQCIDLDLARGRVLALMIMGGSIGLINHLSRHGFSASDSGGEPTSDEIAVSSANITDAGSDATSSSNFPVSTLFVIIQCIFFSPTVLIVFALSAYTLYIIHTFPEYAQERAYSIQDGSDTATASAGPSWVSNVSDSARGSGYQTVDC